MPRTAARPKTSYGIRQIDLQQLTRQRIIAEAMEAQAAQARQLAAATEAFIVTALDHGEHIEPGPLTAAIRKASRRCVKWRKAFERLLGKEAAQAEIDATEPTVTRYLVVSGPAK